MGCESDGVAWAEAGGVSLCYEGVRSMCGGDGTSWWTVVLDADGLADLTCIFILLGRSLQVIEG